MYHKGSVMLHTLRTLIEDDELWFSILRGILIEFENETIDALQVINYINEKSGKIFQYSSLSILII